MDAFTITSFLLALIGSVVSVGMLLLAIMRFYGDRRGPKINFNILGFSIPEKEISTSKIKVEYRLHNVGDMTTNIDFFMFLRALDQSTVGAEDESSLDYEMKIITENYRLKPDEVIELNQTIEFIDPGLWEIPHLEILYVFLDHRNKMQKINKYYKIEREVIEETRLEYFGIEEAKRKYVKKFWKRAKIENHQQNE